MQQLIRGLEARIEKLKQFRTPIAVGAVLFLLASITLLYFILSDKLRQTPDAQLPQQETTTSTEAMLPRRLDGVMVPAGQEALRPIAIMVENHPDRTLPNLRGKLLRCLLAVHSPIFSRVGASGKPGAVHHRVPGAFEAPGGP